jgi:hypothetical protein
MARTILPVTKRVRVNLRWGINFPFDLGKRMSYLTVWGWPSHLLGPRGWFSQPLNFFFFFFFEGLALGGG